jgi:transcriptional regulator with XRE-family HTH domain
MGRHRVALYPGATPGPQWHHRYRLEWGQVVGARIRRLRESRGLFLRDVAATILRSDGQPYSASFMSRLEIGYATPPLWVYIALAEHFEIEPGVLLGREEVARPCTDAELTLLRVLRRLRIDPDDAIARLLPR